MREDIVEQLRENFASKSDEELATLWSEHDTIKYREEAFEAIRREMDSRGQPLPRVGAAPPEKTPIRFASAAATGKAVEVTIAGIELDFGSWVFLMVKVALASIPAIIIIAVILWLLEALLLGGLSIALP